MYRAAALIVKIFQIHGAFFCLGTANYLAMKYVYSIQEKRLIYRYFIQI